MKHSLSLLALGLLACFACDRAPSPSNAPRVPAESIQGPGVVRGKVIFGATPPAPKTLKNEPCCDGAPPTVPDESVVINADGTLANTVVYLQGGARADGKSLSPVVLDQVYCRYTPHVVGVVVGQTLHVKSSDPIPHNVHYDSAFGKAVNVTLMDAKDTMNVTFTAPENIKTRCDVHPWMSAWICVMDTPLFSITRDAGTFEITNVPPGEYKLVAWHELFGRRETTITVTDGTPVQHDFTFAPPK